jgi:hypothetical protein
VPARVRGLTPLARFTSLERELREFPSKRGETLMLNLRPHTVSFFKFSRILMHPHAHCIAVEDDQFFLSKNVACGLKSLAAGVTATRFSILECVISAFSPRPDVSWLSVNAKAFESIPDKLSAF